MDLDRIADGMDIIIESITDPAECVETLIGFLRSASKTPAP